MRFTIITLVASLFIFTQLSAQQVYNSTGKKGDANYRTNQEIQGFDKSKIIYGAGVNLGFGASYYGSSFAAGLFPIAGYRFNKYFSSGISIGYLYRSYSDGQYVTDYNTGQRIKYPLRINHLRGGVWARFTPLPNVNGLQFIFIHAELEPNRTSYRKYYLDVPNQKISYDNISQSALSLLIGPGFKQPVSDRISFVTMILWDVLQNAPINQGTDIYGQKYSKSPYAQTQDIRVGINVGF